MIKTYFLYALLYYLNIFSLQGQMIRRLDSTTLSFHEADKKIKTFMQEGRVTGLGITIFNQNKIVYEKAFGIKNAASGEPLKASTNIYGASLSKNLFSVLVMQLVSRGILDLDKPLQSYLPQPIYKYTPKTRWHDDYRSLETDSFYNRITARMCLSHTTGFSNWRWDEPDQKLRVNFQPGTRYSYSGEGLVYLQVVLEKMLGKNLEALMQENIFGPLKMNMSAYSWQERFEKDYCVGHDTNGKVYEKDKDNEPRSASTLETTLGDYSLFIQAVLQNKLITESTRNMMFTPQIRIRSVQQFGPLRWRDSTLNEDIQLSYGLGWGLLQSTYGTGAFKEGHGDGFQHYTIIFPESGTGILIMTNSDNGEGIFKDLLEFLIGDHFTPWYWEQYYPHQFKVNTSGTESKNK
jgi:D-alanyl-D-alanine-carboxypeptidase/D-alanyl-D-alanine-endopeptidase